MAESRHPAWAEFWYQLLASFLLLAYACELHSTPWHYRALLACLALCLTVSSVRNVLSPTLWTAVVILLAQRLFAQPFLVANHHYCLFYLSLAMLVASMRTPQERLAILESNARFLAVVIMSFAVLHKVFSPSYINGDYLGFMWAKGSYFTPFTQLMTPRVEQVFQSNLQSIVAFHDSTPNSAGSAQLVVPFHHFDLIVLLTVWSILTAELIAAIALLLFPNKLLTLALNGGVVTVIAVARQEFVFLGYYFLLLALSTGGKRVCANILLLSASGILSVIQLCEYLF
jgi:hypothetical protein